MIVPRDFTAALYGEQGEQTAVELYVNPTQGLGASITESVVTQALLDFNGARAAATVAAVMAGGTAGHDAAAQAAAARFLQDGGASQGLVLTDREPLAGGGGEGDKVAPVGLILAGMMVFFLFFGASNVARTILTEDAAGTLPRMLTTPTSTGTILGGKFSSVFLTVTVQTVVLLVAGRVLFGIEWGSLDAVTLLTLVGAAVASGLALLIIAVVRTPGQAGAIGAGVYLVLALLGNFTGTASTSGVYATIQKSHAQRLVASRLGRGDARRSPGRRRVQARRPARLRGRLLRGRGAALQAAVRVNRVWTLGAQGPARDAA